MEANTQPNAYSNSSDQIAKLMLPPAAVALAAALLAIVVVIATHGRSAGSSNTCY
jgi:hypothetical protein